MISFFVSFLKELYRKKSLIRELAVRDFKNAYIGSGLGMTWLFLEPLIYVGVIWFVFSQGLKVKPGDNIPYVAWLMSAMIAWNFFSSVLGAGPSLFKGYRYLLNREFNFSVLPVVKIISGLLVHLIFFGILVVILLLTKVPFTIYWFQSIYYSFCLCVLLLATCWIFGSLGLFVKDVGNFVGVILQLGFWVSPIFWDYSGIPEKYHFFIKLNPLFYPIQGYRDSFLYARPFWTDPAGFLYFWGVTCFLLVAGAYVYRKLRPQFGDVI